MNNTEHYKPMKVNTRLPQYIPIPCFLIASDLSQTAKLLYGLLLSRATLSQKNAMVDEQGNVYVIYTIRHLAEDLGRSEVTVKNAERELVDAGLLQIKRNGYRRANDLYVLLPEGLPPDQQLYGQGKENDTYEGKKSFPHTERKQAPNYIRKTNDTTTKYNYSYSKGESF